MMKMGDERCLKIYPLSDYIFLILFVRLYFQTHRIHVYTVWYIYIYSTIYGNPMGKLLAPRRVKQQKFWQNKRPWRDVGDVGRWLGWESNRSQISGSLEFWMCKILKSKQLLYLTDAFPHLF